MDEPTRRRAPAGDPPPEDPPKRLPPDPERRPRSGALRAAATVLGVALAACTGRVEPSWQRKVDPGRQGSPAVVHAVARLAPTSGHDARGQVHFRERAQGGLRVDLELWDLPPGPHAVHVHINGDCTAPDGSSAGTHFNFRGPSDPAPPGIERITGDLGVLDGGVDGVAILSVEAEHAALQGPFSLLGRSVVVHARGNDPSRPPLGAAGARIACGVIGIAHP